MSGIRGKPPAMYVYRNGGKVQLGDLAARRVRRKWAAVAAALEPPAPSQEQRKRFRVAERQRAAQNLLSLPRPLKPPARRTP